MEKIPDHENIRDVQIHHKRVYALALDNLFVKDVAAANTTMLEFPLVPHLKNHESIGQDSKAILKDVPPSLSPVRLKYPMSSLPECRVKSHVKYEHQLSMSKDSWLAIHHVYLFLSSEAAQSYNASSFVRLSLVYVPLFWSSRTQRTLLERIIHITELSIPNHRQAAYVQAPPSTTDNSDRYHYVESKRIPQSSLLWQVLHDCSLDQRTNRHCQHKLSIPANDRQRGRCVDRPSVLLRLSFLTLRFVYENMIPVVAILTETKHRPTPFQGTLWTWRRELDKNAQRQEPLDIPSG